MSASTILRLAMATLSLATLSSTAVAQDKPQASPAVTYWSTWADKSGSTHQTRCAIGNFKLVEFAPPAAPLWVRLLDAPIKGQQFNIQPVGWTGTWHKNPAPQWIVPVSGRWFIETTDGNRVEMGPGDLAFGGDQAAKDINGHTGHLSGTVGNEASSLMIVQLKQSPKGATHEECPAGGEPLK